MQTTELALMGIAESAERIRGRELSPVELTEACLRRIEEQNPRLNAYITVTAERAIADAQRAEDEISAGNYRGPLHGIPVALKDLYATAGIRTTAGSKILAGWVPEADSTAARRLREAGSVLLGKLNTHEFAYGVTTNNPHFGPTRNPWNPEYIPGGSSGGSGAATAAGLALGTLGSDTGGSIRIPASLCGVVARPRWAVDALGRRCRDHAAGAGRLRSCRRHQPAGAGRRLSCGAHRRHSPPARRYTARLFL
jgi:aspartyl-tRNA(Asn)/glutamyl-tRNA(Gln) amidotransferase subunit A